MGLILLLFVFLLIVGALPTWPYTRDRGYGYYPSGLLGVLLVIVLVLILLGVIPHGVGTHPHYW